MDGFDLIGDIHGHGDALRALLTRLGYVERFGVYRHPHRKAIFLGDFIDRGPGQREVLDVVRAMVDEGHALAVMGNHELNALAYHTPHPDAPDNHLRPHSQKNAAQHRAFLEAFEDDPAGLADTLDWFYGLPLWLDLDELRVIHAAWHPAAMDWVSPRLMPERTLTQSLLVESTREGSPAFEAVETLLKGVEAPLPEGVAYHDKGGHLRRAARVKWWLAPEGRSWRSMLLVPAQTAARLPETPLPPEFSPGYPAEAPPVFIGHYWLRGSPAPLTRNVACLDYSVALPGGKLAAYRWDGESQLDAAKFEWVERSGG